jgi:hypothetical protein
MGQLIIFDWGALARPASGATFRKSEEPYVWIEDPEAAQHGHLRSSRRELLEWVFDQRDSQIAVVRNEGGIAWGIIDWAETEEKVFALLKELPFHVPFLVCPYHPKYPALYPEYEFWRMPAAQMLIALHGLYPEIKREQVLVVGCLEENRGAAEHAGFAYQDAETFFAEIEQELETFIREEQTVEDGILF